MSLSKYFSDSNKNDSKSAVQQPVTEKLDSEDDKIEQMKNDIKQYKYDFSKNQKKAVRRLIKFLCDSEQKIFCLFGYAGTGKTTTIVEFVNFLMDNGYIKKIAMTAPTNKATMIIKSKFSPHLLKKANTESFENALDILKEQNKKYVFITIHKLLNYKSQIDSHGTREYIRTKKARIQNFDLVIIDECSMISNDMTIELLHEIEKSNKIKVIFLGDSCQLPPVNEKMSKIFSDEFNSYTLTKVVRTNKDNIINACNNLRDWIDNNMKPTIGKFVGNGVYVYRNKLKNDKTNNEWFDKFMEYHISDKNEHSSNIILAWTNNQCSIYNKTIRNRLFGNNDHKMRKFEPNDILILNDYYKFMGVLYTSEQVRVKTVQSTTIKLDKFIPNDKLSDITGYEQVINKLNIEVQSYQMKIWKLSVIKLSSNTPNTCEHQNISPPNEYHMNIIHDDSQYIMDKLIDKTHTIITKYKTQITPEYMEKKINNIFQLIWKDWYSILIEPFANVSIGCSISCHKSQSSTYANVFIDVDDILNNPNTEEAKRCLYTAHTRASNEIHILI